MSIRVSVVVPTYQRPDLLRKCLHALIRQDFPGDEYEIIVVDDAGSEATRSLAEQVSAEAGTRICYAAATLTRGPAAARNLGWRMARGAVIAFTDDDCLPEPGWLREGIAALREDLAGVSGKVIVPVASPPSDYEKNVARLNECEFVTANCFYRRAALEACGGFDERFTTAWREDSDLQFRMLTLSYRLGRAPAARVVHPVRPAPWGVSIKEQRKSMFNALLFKKYPDLYRGLIGADTPLRYYAIVLLTVGFFAALVLGSPTLAALMAWIWLGLILHFIFQRLRGTRRTPSHILEMLFTSIVIPYLSVFWRLRGAVLYRVWFF